MYVLDLPLKWTYSLESYFCRPTKTRNLKTRKFSDRLNLSDPNTSKRVHASAQHWCLLPKTRRRIIPSFIRNSEATGDIFLGK